MLTPHEFTERFREKVEPRHPDYFASRDSQVTYEIVLHFYQKLVGDEAIMNEVDYVNAVDRCLAGDINLTRARILKASKEFKAQQATKPERRK